MGEVPLGGRGLGTGLHHHVFWREGVTEGEGGLAKALEPRGKPGLDEGGGAHDKAIRGMRLPCGCTLSDVRGRDLDLSR